MDDLAAVPTPRSYDDAGRVRDENLRARKKSVKRAHPAPSPSPELGVEPAPEPGPEADANHELDLLA
jgi:hypothetical protein